MDSRAPSCPSPAAASPPTTSKPDYYVLASGFHSSKRVSWNDCAGRYPFCNPKLSMDERVDDLIKRLTLDEKPYL